MQYTDRCGWLPDMTIIEGSLVDVQGALIDKGKLNKPLYDAMLKAENNGENVYLFSARGCEDQLQKAGVDLDKFGIIMKSDFRKNHYMILGKVVSDKKRHELQEEYVGFHIADVNNCVSPDAKIVEFSCDEKPEGIEKKRNVDVMASSKSLALKRRIDLTRKTPADTLESEEASYGFSGIDLSSAKVKKSR